MAKKAYFKILKTLDSIPDQIKHSYINSHYHNFAKELVVISKHGGFFLLKRKKIYYLLEYCGGSYSDVDRNWTTIEQKLISALFNKEDKHAPFINFDCGSRFELIK